MPIENGGKNGFILPTSYLKDGNAICEGLSKK